MSSYLSEHICDSPLVWLSPARWPQFWFKRRFSPAIMTCRASRNPAGRHRLVRVRHELRNRARRPKASAWPRAAATPDRRSPRASPPEPPPRPHFARRCARFPPISTGRRPDAGDYKQRKGLGRIDLRSAGSHSAIASGDGEAVGGFRPPRLPEEPCPNHRDWCGPLCPTRAGSSV